MKITLYRSRLDISLGFPASETFTVTPKMLRAWNASHHRLGGISANEHWNAEQGLPCPAACKWLKSLHDRLHGICNPSEPLTMADVTNALS